MSAASASSQPCHLCSLPSNCLALIVSFLYGSVSSLRSLEECCRFFHLFLDAEDAFFAATRLNPALKHIAGVSILTVSLAAASPMQRAGIVTFKESVADPRRACKKRLAALSEVAQRKAERVGTDLEDTDDDDDDDDDDERDDDDDDDDDANAQHAVFVADGVQIPLGSRSAFTYDSEEDGDKTTQNRPRERASIAAELTGAYGIHQPGGPFDLMLTAHALDAAPTPRAYQRRLAMGGYAYCLRLYTDVCLVSDIRVRLLPPVGIDSNNSLFETPPTVYACVGLEESEFRARARDLYRRRNEAFHDEQQAHADNPQALANWLPPPPSQPAELGATTATGASGANASSQESCDDGLGGYENGIVWRLLPDATTSSLLVYTPSRPILCTNGAVALTLVIDNDGWSEATGIDYVGVNGVPLYGFKAGEDGTLSYDTRVI